MEPVTSLAIFLSTSFFAMPKAKKTRGRRKRKQVPPVSEEKDRDRLKTKQSTATELQRVRSMNGAAPRGFAKRIRIDMTTSGSPVTDGQGDTQHLQPDTVLTLNAPPAKAPETSSLRGYPSPVATVNGEAFQNMAHDLQSEFQSVFHELNNAIDPEKGSSGDSKKTSRRPGRRFTRSSTEQSHQFFKSLIPKDKIPNEEKNIKVVFEGTNSITTNAPGYTETITFGNGIWTRTRNGIMETGRLDEEEAVRIAEQTKQTIDRMMLHTASRLQGMMEPSEWFSGVSRAVLNESTPPPSAVMLRKGSLWEEGFFGVSSTSGCQNGTNGPEMTKEGSLGARRKARPKAADMFERNGD